MVVKNYELGFTFEIDSQYTEIKSTSFDVFEVTPNTLHYFVTLNDDGKVARALSLTKEERKCKNEDDFKEIIENNLKNFEELDLQYVLDVKMTTPEGRDIERLVVYSPEDDIYFCTYFTIIKSNVVACTARILEDFDEYESEMYEMFQSIKEL